MTFSALLFLSVAVAVYGASRLSAVRRGHDFSDVSSKRRAQSSLYQQHASASGFRPMEGSLFERKFGRSRPLHVKSRPDQSPEASKSEYADQYKSNIFRNILRALASDRHDGDRWMYEKRGPPCDKCPAHVIKPVCGNDGRTYSNMCFLNCNNAKKAHNGECQIDNTCVCTLDHKPVCGEDGITYGNQCQMECNDVELDHAGKCGGCICTADYKPVCGKDGITYPNQCSLECHGAEKEKDGECKSDCVCPLDYAPVCGDDGETYPNECSAECAGVAKESNGACDEIVKPPCGCQYIYAPVCSTEGETFPNECALKCEGGFKDKDGVCGGCSCFFIYAPVCDTEGKLYPNKCVLECQGKTESPDGICLY